ncbi:pathogenesis-related leaf protein 6-like [Bidens hawaiensis]|uniref:pathogenesis-related leaf protein 6-like n=1 Tax=Bidens hawaiensis TaxID=980011 RepID=UPI00404B23E4
MGSIQLQFALICFLSLPMFHNTHAQNTPRDYLDAHNAARARVGVGNIVWNKTVADYAQSYVNKRSRDCNLVLSGGPYGENLAKGSSALTGTVAVNFWASEEAYYDHTTNTCARGHDCRLYTQVVWRNSVQLGCSRVKCANNGRWFVMCSYHPPGNYVGQSPY